MMAAVITMIKQMMTMMTMLREKRCYARRRSKRRRRRMKVTIILVITRHGEDGRALKLSPVTRQAAISPIAGPNLKPSPAKPPTIMTSGSAGCTPTTKSW